MGNEGLLNENDEVEIDLLQIFRALKKRIFAILAAGALVGGIVGGISKFVLTPQYTSTAMVYILSKETTLTSLADLQIGSQLTKDYKIIVTSRPVLEDVIQKLGLDLTYKELMKKIEIDNPADTRILSVTAEDADPVAAKNIADAIAKTSSEYIGDIMEMIPPKIIEEGVVAVEQSSPNNLRNALIGVLFGMLLVCGVTAAEVVMNDTVQNEEDVEKYLGLTVLASVPLREGEQEEDKDAETMNRSKAKKQTGSTGKKKKRSGRK